MERHDGFGERVEDVLWAIRGRIYRAVNWVGQRVYFIEGLFNFDFYGRDAISSSKSDPISSCDVFNDGNTAMRSEERSENNK